MAKGTQTATAGFDYTFSVPKSVSVLWGVADAGTQALIVEAHHQAVAEVLDFMEREVAVTRAGRHRRRRRGRCRQTIVGVAADGVRPLGLPRRRPAAAHPRRHLQQGPAPTEDGRWRSLDRRPMFAAVVALSEHYNAVLADTLTRPFGVEWERRDRGTNRNPGLGAAPASPRS